MEINDRNTFTGCGWMRTELDLDAAQLVCYALIYSYTQFSKEQCYSEGYQFLADWCKVSKRTIVTYVDEFVKKGIVERTQSLFNTTVLKTTDYRVKNFHPIECNSFTPSSEIISPDAHAMYSTIYNIILNNILNISSSSITRVQEKVLNWLTDDEEYLISNLRTNRLIDNLPTKEEIASISYDYIKGFTEELVNQGVDIDIKGRLDTKRHFSNWLKKKVSYERKLNQSKQEELDRSNKSKKEYNLE